MKKRSKKDIPPLLAFANPHPAVIEAGCDEAGRGCLAGPVYAAAVVLPKNFFHAQLADSKTLLPAVRQTLRNYIQANAIAWAVASCTPAEIDQHNILWASVLAMHRAIDALPQQHRPSHLLIDGNKFKPYPYTPHTCIIGGDATYVAIAAAAVLAKTYRDDYMLQLHEQYPQYNFNTNMGYPTKAHRQAIAQFGITPHHRLTFTLLPK